MFNEEYATFQMFSLAHLIPVLILLALLIGIFVFRHKINPRMDKFLRRGVAILMIAMEWTFYGWSLSRGPFQTSLLPMGLCAISMYLTAIALWTDSPKITKLIYPWAITGALLSLIVADQPYLFPHFRYLHYFGNHSLFLLGTVYMVVFKKIRFVHKDVLASSALLLVYALIVYPLNFVLGSNHLFLRELPHEVAFLFEFLGDFWPIGFGVAIFILFHLVSLPVLIHKSKRPKASEPESNLMGVDGTPRSPHWKRTIRWFVSGQLVSLFGSMLVQYAITWYITLTTQSGLMMTLSILFGFLPSLLMSPLAGAWADRYDRKKLMVLADSFIALVTLVFAIVFLLGEREIWLLLVMSALRSFGGAVHMPAVSASYPDIVPQDRLMKVQGLVGGLQHGLMLFAPFIAAGLLAVLPLHWIFSIDVVTAAIAIFILVAFVALPKRTTREGEETHPWRDIADGVKYVRDHHFLIPFFIFTAIILFLVAPVAFLTPLQVVRTYGQEVWRLSAIEVAFSAGMVGGSLLVAALGGFKNRIHTMVVAMIIMGVGTAFLGLIPWFVPYLLFMALIGLALPFYNTASTVMIQEQVEPAFLGRVFSVFGMISSTAMPLGMLVFGPFADVVEIKWILIGTGIAMSIASWAMIFNKKLVHAGIPKSPVGMDLPTQSLETE
jgi:DHA3 family macrolide efflux protein-like MFS transporter